MSGSISLLRANLQIRMVVYFAAAIFFLRRLKWNPILVMVLCGVAEVVFTAAFD